MNTKYTRNKNTSPNQNGRTVLPCDINRSPSVVQRFGQSYKSSASRQQMPYPDFSIVISSCQQGAVHREDRAAHTAFVALQFMKRGREFKTPNLEDN